MSRILARDTLTRIEDYQVETLPDANIIVNANETNWNQLPEVMHALQSRAADHAFNRYPPMHGEDLSAAIGKKLGIAPEQVVVGNGSSELLEKVCYAFGGKGRKIAVPVPSFSMYQTYAVLADSEPACFSLTEEGLVDPDAVIAFCKKQQPSLLIICNPNNPTGTFTGKKAMEKIIRQMDCPVVMDEAYMDFAVEEGTMAEISTLDLVNQVDNLLVLKTFSKAYGLANLRIGYGVGSPEVMQVLKKVLLPYTVNGFSLMAAETLFQLPGVLQGRVQAVIKGRKYLAENLQRLGFKVLPSATNFLLVQPQGAVLDNLGAKAGASSLAQEEKAKAAGSYLFHALLQEKILVRDFSQHPLLPGALRITVGTDEENAQIIAGIRGVLQNGEG